MFFAWVEAVHVVLLGALQIAYPIRDVLGRWKIRIQKFRWSRSMAGMECARKFPQTATLHAVK